MNEEENSNLSMDDAIININERKETDKSLKEEIDVDDIEINIDDIEETGMDLDWEALNEEIKKQVNEELAISDEENEKIRKRKQLKHNIIKAVGATVAVLLFSIVFLVGTKTGRKIIYRIAGDFIHDNVDVVDSTIDDIDDMVDYPHNDSNIDKVNSNQNKTTDKQAVQAMASERIIPRSEEYVSNFLIFGIEEIEGAKNTDAILIASINTKDDTIKLTSLLRDTLVNIPGHSPNKLNAVYGQGGASLLVETVEQNYRIKIDGYASINFDAFESVVNLLGGVSIQLGEEEAKYLNTTNYISNKAYRNVVPGWNVLNGNQALGYVRVRRVPTLGGANDDYGRTLRQRRAMTAIFNKYKGKNLFDLLSITQKCLGYVKTNVTQEQIELMLEDVVENVITSLDTFRVPVNGMFDDPSSYGGVSSPLVLDWESNIKELYEFIFLDEEINKVTDNLTE
ncbi:MAG: LCP family protein [Clostridiales bacterium]|nr:LCP family protein [Clostridiales bacterium]